MASYTCLLLTEAYPPAESALMVLIWYVTPLLRSLPGEGHGTGRAFDVEVDHALGCRTVGVHRRVEEPLRRRVAQDVQQHGIGHGRRAHEVAQGIRRSLGRRAIQTDASIGLAARDRDEPVARRQ